MMNTVLEDCRQMVANHKMAAIADATADLIELYGHDGARVYLNAQLVMLAQMTPHSLDDEKKITA